MKPKLESTNIAIRDITDQPASPYILIIDGILGTKAAFAVSKVLDSGGMFVAYGPTKDGYASVQLLSFPYHTNWTLIARGSVETHTVETWERKRSADIKACMMLERELYPGDGTQPQAGPVEVVTIPTVGGQNEYGVGFYL